jgi:hypothetical protein
LAVTPPCYLNFTCALGLVTELLELVQVPIRWYPSTSPPCLRDTGPLFRQGCYGPVSFWRIDDHSVSAYVAGLG